MGVFWSHGIQCDKKTIKKLIDDENWFNASLIEYNTLSKSQNKSWNCNLQGISKNESVKSNAIFSRNLFHKSRKCFGRITVLDDCIIFQGVHCNDLLRAIINNQEKSPQSIDTVFDELPVALPSNRNILHSASSTSTTSGGPESESLSNDRLHTFVWPLETIRHFGYKDNFFSFDSGRFSSTGEGRFTFKIKKLASFLTMFQNSKPKEISQVKLSQSFQVSPDYYNLKSTESYPVLKNELTDNLNRLKIVSKSTEVFFNSDSPLCSPTNGLHDYGNLSPLKYTNIDFTDSNGNVSNFTQTMPSVRRRPKSNIKSLARESIHYLTICENQTKAVEKVLKRIG